MHSGDAEYGGRGKRPKAWKRHFKEPDPVGKAQRRHSVCLCGYGNDPLCRKGSARKVWGALLQNELAQGTPFYMEGAKELMRLGILTICIPLGTQVITELIYEIGAQVIQGAAPFKVDAGVNVTLGIMLLFMSLLCRLGAEYRGKNL